MHVHHRAWPAGGTRRHEREAPIEAMQARAAAYLLAARPKKSHQHFLRATDLCAGAPTSRTPTTPERSSFAATLRCRLLVSSGCGASATLCHVHILTKLNVT